MTSVTPASQPGSNSPFDSLWLNKVATLLRDLIIANVALAFGNISVLGVHPFDFLTQWGHDLQQKASDAYTGQQTANAKADGAATILGLSSGNDLLGTLNPTSIWSHIFSTFISPLITVASNLVDVVQGFFGVTAGSNPLADLTKLGSNLRSILGNPDLNTSSFDPISAGENMLQEVLTPAGALTSLTQIPQHLLGQFNIGQFLTLPGFAKPVYNLQPDPEFTNAQAIAGGGVWTRDATLSQSGTAGTASIKATASSIVRQGIFLPIATKPGQITDLGVYTHWTGATSSTGHSISLLALAYDANDDLISDPTNMLVSAVDHISGSSSGYSGIDPVTGTALTADANGFVHMVGTYLAPAGCVNVRVAIEIESSVSAGVVAFTKITQSLRDGLVDSNLLTNIENFAGQWDGGSVAGFAGITDLIATFQHIADGLGSAYDPTGAVSDITLPNLFALAQAQTTNSITAAFQAALHQIILANRTNKSAGFGANPTSLSSLEVGHYSSGGVLTTQTVAAGSAIGMRYTVPEFATYGFAEILASIPSGTNHVYLNAYKIDPTTNAKTALFNSADLAVTIGTSITSQNRILLPGMPQVQASDELLWEIVNASASNALTLVTKQNAMPNNTNEVIQNVGWSRSTSAGGASPTSLTSGQGSYTGTNPFVNIGIANVPANYHPPTRTQQTAAGSYSIGLPSWLSAGDKVDLVGIGGGGGGGSSFFGVGGGDGKSSDWAYLQLIVGTDIVAGSTINYTVGGRGSSGGSSSAGGTGGSTTFSWTHPTLGTQTMTIAGGAGGAYGGGGGGGTGVSPQNQTYDGITYFGAAAVGAGSTGQSPGGGGGGAISYLNGTSGGVGEADLVFEQAA